MPLFDSSLIYPVNLYYKMHRVAILYSTKSGEKEELVCDLAAAFQELKCHVSVRKAGDAAITDITAAEIVVLGSEGDGVLDGRWDG